MSQERTLSAGPVRRTCLYEDGSPHSIRACIPAALARDSLSESVLVTGQHHTRIRPYAFDESVAVDTTLIVPVFEDIGGEGIP